MSYERTYHWFLRNRRRSGAADGGAETGEWLELDVDGRREAAVRREE